MTCASRKPRPITAERRRHLLMTLKVASPPRELPAARLRILHVVPAYYPAVRYGGPIRSVHGLAAALAQRGHEVHVATTSVDGEDDLDVPLDRAVDLDGVTVHYFRVPALRRLCWAPAMAKWLKQSVAGFDVVHLHSVFLWPMWAAARAAHAAHIPYVMAPRGMLVGEIIRRKNRWVKTAWINLIERTTLRQAAGLHVTADLEAEEARALGLPMPAVFCVPNGVGTPRTHAQLSAGPFGQVPRPYALFLSRISWKKGLDRLITAWQWVPDLHLIIAGNDDENYRPQMEALARAAGLGDRVRFVGPVSDEHKWALYENAELFVLPSYSENFGNVVAEAMAMSCPVIVSPDVGIASLVRTFGAGIVANCEARQLAEHVRSLHHDPARRRDMGARGRRAVAEELSWEAVAARMDAVYAHLAADARPRPQLAGVR
jgi:glycosyltransferase involved in cell wall biosynthesis